MQKSVEAAETQLASTDEAIQGLSDEGSNLQEQLKLSKAAAAEAHGAVKAQKDALASNRNEMSALQNKSEKMAKAEQNRELEVKELTHTITRQDKLVF